MRERASLIARARELSRARVSAREDEALESKQRKGARASAREGELDR